MTTCHSSPAVTCALAIIRDCTELAPASQAVAASVFVVTDDTVSTSFNARTAVVLPALSRQEAIKHIASMIPRDARVIMRSPRLPRGLVRQLAKGRPMPAPTDAQTLATVRPDCDVRPIALAEHAMVAVARHFDIWRAGKGDITAEKARRCEAEAQTLFLSQLFTTLHRHERNRLTAAYQAWSALQRARPLGQFGPTEIF